MNKQVLRRELRATRARFALTNSVAVGDGWRARLQRGMMVATYIPVGSEADPAPLHDVAVAAGCTLALPHVVDHATPLRFLAWQDEAPLAAGPFGLTQPADTAQVVVPDIVITPLLGFDRRGNRLGQGAGHYDRAFAAHPRAWRVGVAWSVQEVAMLEPDAWDVPLHAIATEREWIAP